MRDAIATGVARTLCMAVALLGACGGDDGGPAPTDAGVDAADDAGDLGACLADAAALPAPVAGRCRAVVRPEALLPVGPDGAGGFIVPDGRRVTIAGTRVELPAGLPMRSLEVPGTPFVVVTDGTVDDEYLVVVDRVAGRVVASEPFLRRGAGRRALFLGLAVTGSGPLRRVWASGGGSNAVYAYDLDAATGALTEAPGAHVRLRREGATFGYVSGIALVGDVLAVVTLLGDEAVFFDARTGAELGATSLGVDVFPYDLAAAPDGRTLYASLWGARAVVPIDVATRAAGAPIAVGKNPEGLALSPSGGTLAVANNDSDSVTLIDVATRTVRETVPLRPPGTPRNASPSHVAFDGEDRFYVVSANENSVDVFARAGVGGSFTLAGRLPTMWYPTDVQVLGDGALLVTNAKDDSTGPNLDPASAEISELLRGSVTVLPRPDADELRALTAEVTANNARMRRFVDVECDPGAPYDFPVPRPGMGPSTKIEHVIVLMRENKTYDAYFGDLTDDGGAPHGDGDPALTLLPRDQMDRVLANTRRLAREFTLGDNHYSNAEKSTQGHFWHTVGRNTDLNERTWHTSAGRGYWAAPAQAILDGIGYPEEGSFFEYLGAQGVTFDVFGEIVGTTRLGGPTRGFPGYVYTLEVTDRARADWLARRWASCRLSSYTFALFPRDHTYGGSGGRPTPQAMMADSDDGIGRAIEAISHSTFWPKTAVFIVWDDPQDGGDHVDNHRAGLLVVSPWARRGHVTRVHTSESSVLRTAQLILGLSAPHNQQLEEVAPLYDAFTSTPDYTPFVATPRTWPDDVNPRSSPMAIEAARWDFAEPDAQPGLSRQLWRMLRGTEPPWPDLPEDD
jgi:YVTN family beta-propeller protein